MNGEPSSSAVVANSEQSNGMLVNGIAEPSLEQLEAELPVVEDGQIPLGEVLSRVMQAIYTELQEMGETYANCLFIFCCQVLTVYQSPKSI